MTSFPGYALGHQWGHTRVKGDLTHAHTHRYTVAAAVAGAFGSHHSWRAAYSSAHKRTKRTALRKFRLRNLHAVKQQCGGRDGGRKGEGRTSALLRRFCGSLAPWVLWTEQFNGCFNHRWIASLIPQHAFMCLAEGLGVFLFRRCAQMAASIRVQSNKKLLNTSDSQTCSSEELKSTGFISIVLIFFWMFVHLASLYWGEIALQMNWPCQWG